MTAGQRWLPLLLFGTLGMLLSEFAIWNIAPVARLLDHGPLAASLLVVPWLGYALVFVVIADLAVRFKVRDAVGLVLLGSLYGLFNEGVMADKVFGPGLGPAVLGLRPLNMTFTGLSWHAFIDVPLGMLLVKLILTDRLGLGDPRLTRRGCAAALGFACWMYSWNNFAAVQDRFPAGIPARLQAFWLGCALALGGLSIHAALACAPMSAPAEILDGRKKAWVWGLMAAAAALRFRLAEPTAALFFTMVVLAYWGLFVLHCRLRPTVPERSLYEESFPAHGRLSWAKYLKLAAVFLSGFAALSALGLRKTFMALDAVMILAMVAAAVAFPALVVKRLVQAALAG
ncbi:hypothetical protein EPO15_05275 [bacterium]|nr:MAG: hypothetical protein EPO15_05275 [bacterium]